MQQASTAPPLLDVTFDGLTISLPAKSAREAYDLLCEHLAKLDGCEFTTGTFSVDGKDGGDTSELWDAEDAGEQQSAPGSVERVHCACGDFHSGPCKPDHDLAAWEGEGGRAL